MDDIADHFQRILIPFLSAMGAMVLLLLVCGVVGRAIESVRGRRRSRLIRECQPLVDQLMLPHSSIRIAEQLACYVPMHGDVVAALLAAPARFVAGPAIDQLRHTARAFGAIEKWRRDLSSRRWWIRAAAARALGHLADASAIDALVATLNDDDEEVRAAGVEALGNIGDPRTIPAIVSRLPDQSRHQRVRVFEALRRFGRAAVPSLLAYEQLHQEDRAIIAELLGQITAPEVIDDLLGWTGDQRPAVRIAAMHALGSIGLDERGYYYALRALSRDEDPEVRAMAARALGRSGRREAAPYLAKHLKDEWIVAAHAVAALRALGHAGAIGLGQSVDVNETSGLAHQPLLEFGSEMTMMDAVAL